MTREPALPQHVRDSAYERGQAQARAAIETGSAGTTTAASVAPCGVELGAPSPAPAPTPKTPPLDTAQLLEAVVAYTTRYVVLTQDQARAIALWVLHTHAFEALGITPYLWITSAEKSSGKTQLLETLQQVVARPWFTGSVTAAVLARKIDHDRPTLLLDESDAAFKGDKEYAEALRGVLNTGFKASGTYSRCAGASGTSLKVVDFSTFCPKAVAGIGKLPDTVVSRSIPIRLQRKTAAERIHRFRQRQVEAEGAEIRAALACWSQASLDPLSHTDLEPLDQLGDRAFDVWEPLLGIAELAGGTWPVRARAAALALSGKGAQEDDSLGARLLADIRVLMGDADRIYSSALAARLNAIEEAPWGGWSQGAGIKPREIAKILRPFEIMPRTIRASGEATTGKGYHRESLEDAWARYLPPAPPEPAVRTSQPAPLSQNGATADRHNRPAVTVATNAANRHGYSDVTAVTAVTPPATTQSRVADNSQLDEEQLAALGTARLDDLRRHYECGE